MFRSKSFLDSLSPFWFIIDPTGLVDLHSDYFVNKLKVGESFLNFFELKKVFIRNQKNMIESLEGKTIRLKCKTMPTFRTTVHRTGDKALLIGWPILEHIKEIKEYGLEKEMTHPAALITDIVIAKDMYRKNFLKLRDMESLKLHADKLSEFSNIVSSTSSSFSIISKNKEVTFINEQGLDFLEVSHIDEVNAQGLDTFIIEEYRDEFMGFHEKIIQGEKSSLIFQIVGKKGTSRWVETFSAPMKLPNGEIGHVAISNDITERVKMEEERENQKKMSFHTSKLASLGQLAAGVGHEINNPMAIIRGNLEMIEKSLLEKEPDKEKVEVCIGKINTSIERVVNIVKGLKVFSRDDLESLEVIDVRQMLQESVDLLQDIYSLEGVNINTNFQANLYTEASYGRLQQVVVNLLANAKDATSKIPNTISVSSKREGNNIEIRVSDKGSGIPVDILDKIFDPFFTTKKVNEGTGIGLSISHQIINDYGGMLVVEKSDEEGTTFLINLKPTDSIDLQDDKNDHQENEEMKTTPFVAKNILVVDDEPDIIDIVSFIVEDRGHNILTAQNGQEAWDIIQDKGDEIDILITDMQMPVMNGHELLKNVSTIKNRNFLRLVISGGVNIDVQALEKESLIDGFLAKPFTSEDLIKVIQDLEEKSK